MSSQATPPTVPDAPPTGGLRGFRHALRQRLRREWPARYALRFLYLLVAIALLADLIAYDKPIVCDRGEGIEFPIVGDYLADWGIHRRDPKLIHQDWRKLDYAWSVWPPVRYLPHEIDYKNQRLQGPFDPQREGGWKYRHHLGTDRDGRDVLSGLVHGTRLSLTIGLVAMGIAGIIGVILGALAGYFGDNRWKLSRLGILLGVAGLVLGYFYGFQVRAYVLGDALASGAGAFLFQLTVSLAILFLVPALLIQLARPFRNVPYLGKRVNVWVDVLVSRVIEIKSTIPTLLLIITIMSLTERKSAYFVMVVIGLLGWQGVARFMRAEMLRTRSMAFVESARALGLPEWRILLRHAIPNSLTSVLVVFTFGIAGAIVAEASLSFLGIGVPDDVVTWGGMLHNSRANLSAWWLSVFPGTAVFLTVTALNLVGEALRDVLDPRMRHE